MTTARRPERPRYDPKDPFPNIQRVPPQAAEAEAQVLAGILLYPDAMGMVRGNLSPGDFYTEAHRAIYRAACVVEDSGQGVDRVMVAQTLDEQGFADLAGGRAYLASLVSDAPLKHRLPRYADEIRKAASLRELIESAGQIIGMAYDRERPTDKILEDSQEMVAQVRARGLGPAGLPTMTAAELAVREVPDTVWILPEILRDGLSLFGGKSKIGKAQPIDCRVMTPFGWRPMGEIAVGDMVTGTDGRPARVVAVHPQGTVPVFRVRFSDGSSTRATADHLWQIQGMNDRFCGRPGRVCSTSEIASLLASGRVRHTYVPMADPVEFAAQAALPIDPYALGLILGDGGITKGVTFSSDDPELYEALALALPGTMELHRTADGRGVSVVGVSRRRGPQAENPVRSALADFGLLGCRSEEKFIPPQYKIASVAERLSLLQGLMDTDGGVESRAAIFNTSSRGLALDVQELVEGLGGTAKVGTRERNVYSHQAERREGLPSYRLSVRLPRWLGPPFRLKRKAEQWMARQTSTRRRPVRKIVAVDPDGLSEAQCITVAASNGLYLTDHCIVTHNSWFVYQIGLWVAMGWDPISKLQTEPRDALYLALEDDDRRLKSRLLQLLNGDRPPDRLHLGMSCPTLDNGAAARICGFLDSHPETALVIVDTFARVRGVPDPRGNAYYQDYDVLARLQRIALDRRFSLLLVHHLNKVDHDDPFDSLSGSTGMQGPTDGMMILQRSRQETLARLMVTGRGVPDRRLKLEWSDLAGWSIIGDCDAFERSEGEIEVLEMLAEKGGPMTPAALAGALGKKRPSMCRQLKTMENRSLLSSTGGWYQPTAQGLEALNGSA